MFVYTLLFYSDLLKKKRGLVLKHQGPGIHPTPSLVLAGSAGKRKDGLMNSITSDLLELSGRARIRAMFWPRQRAGLIEAGKVIGISYPQLSRRIQQGKLALKVRKDEYEQMFVTIDDLAAYLYPDPDDQSSQPSLPPSPSVFTKRGPGRPRKGTEGGGR